MLISLDNELLTCKPDQIKAAQISKRIAKQPVDISIEDLAKSLLLGQTWCPAVFELGQRRAQNFKSLQFIAVDIDKNNWQLNDIFSTAQTKNLKPAIVHESMSSSEGNRKWRIIFALDEPVTSAQLALQIARYMQTIFGGDPAVVDVARLFYGAKAKGMFMVDTSNIIQISALKDMESVIPTPTPQKVISEPTAQASIAKMSKITRVRLAYRMDEIKKVMADPEGTAGSGYKAVWNSAMKLAQIEGVTSEAIHTVINKLAKESQAFNGWQYWDKIDGIIDNAINWGRNHAKA